jgi:hypothetical protein
VGIQITDNDLDTILALFAQGEPYVDVVGYIQVDHVRDGMVLVFEGCRYAVQSYRRTGPIWYQQVEFQLVELDGEGGRLTWTIPRGSEVVLLLARATPAMFSDEQQAPRDYDGRGE